MKLSFRGNSYEVPAPTEPVTDSTDRPKFKLIYRGYTYDYTPPPLVVSEEVETDVPTVTLIYRRNTYERKLPPPKPLSKAPRDRLALEV
jgi:Domain of unknown function (DUF4278)